MTPADATIEEDDAVQTYFSDDRETGARGRPGRSSLDIGTPSRFVRRLCPAGRAMS